MTAKIISIILLALGAALCFGAGKIAEGIFKEKTDEKVLNIKLLSFAFVALGLLVLFMFS